MRTRTLLPAAALLAVGALLAWLAASGRLSQTFAQGKKPAEASGGPQQPAAAALPPAKIDAEQPTATLFKNAKVFDGKSDKLTASTSVLVVGMGVILESEHLASAGLRLRHDQSAPATD